jgi:NADH:ubiquinone oxidoreductase subunit F (NADH-binding)
VREVPFGTAWTEVLGDRVGRPVLLGGYHGTWTRPETLTDLVVSREQLAGAGLTLGAGVVLPTDECPVVRSAHLAGYLAGESAGRCGPCFNGLPALASALRGVAAGAADPSEVQRLSALVVRRGACAHPDGVARMVASLLAAFPDEVARHVRGGCELWDQGLREVV